MKKAATAQELCAKLILRSLKNLTEDEEEIVFDYLFDLGYDVDADTPHQKLCTMLLDASMKKDLGRQVPTSAYANSLIEKAQTLEQQRVADARIRQIEMRRLQQKRALEEKAKVLPGCDLNNDNLVSKNLQIFMLSEQLGYSPSDGLHTAAISVPEKIYSQIFSQLTTPIVELVLSNGTKAYARITDYHESADSNIYISRLVADILGLKSRSTGGFLRLCNSLPEISMVKFTYYGTRAELDADLPLLIEKLPRIVTGFSYLSLGTLLYVRVQDDRRLITVRVEKLLSQGEEEIFAGILPPGEGDLPFDIQPDV